jgi:hypothetical protein
MHNDNRTGSYLLFTAHLPAPTDVMRKNQFPGYIIAAGAELFKKRTTDS